jgi:predicted nucleotidyltransferase
MTDFQSLLRSLVDASVEFILVGGVAAVVHGSARLTQDIDIV